VPQQSHRAHCPDGAVFGPVRPLLDPLLLADREFLGQEWLAFLIARRIPFAIRVKENRTIELPTGKRMALRSLLMKVRNTHCFEARFPQGLQEKMGHQVPVRRCQNVRLHP